ncbi:hypothetical protein [Bradyrhizobium japonicum]|uniref:hypothetical protein n=1 Tax=Bradyrhizobium japonicum TaxID=375 RepID=UPI0020A0C811|nr:hypothetical protein [Bradyrhizobium japonicum]MCP1760973.1 hypothetical protein [Bradyrhizobium japonicum]MCP1792552.1 hypothetical protein [Bradyrhizobium japonicum]MCP1804987.1 hypothetical protein [Bradyrhizobium japonicum]MCP1814008.1 hypothetical protein [Bradyrhizobium japonicum]MCP1874570.1 hypothetical protein [Bradyrhizobium japonicum]
MAGKVEVSQFTGAFAKLNGSTDITATRPDIIRSLLTVGYPSRKAALRKVGPWRIRMLSAMGYGYLDLALRTTAYFRNLEQTEKVGVSFLLGQAFTHWFAQERMDIAFLLHVAGFGSATWGTSSAGASPKTGASPPLPNSRPDFIGMKKAEMHVFESKGRIRRPAQSAIAKALGQVSALRSIDGTQPATRCATFFTLKASGAEGQVIDPEADAAGLELTFDPWEMIAETYSFFLDGENAGLPDPASEGYVGREIDAGVYYAVDKKVLDAVAGQAPTSTSERQQRLDEIFGILAHRAGSYRERRTEEVSAGPEGLLLVDQRRGRHPPPP